ncbi:alkaline phytoceramidase [Bimuria novae-zelandiae CBS 107.79]|uniref:Alkaline phytoceramidase n=1 Tax=Bimuria novae-zelandiae CBS 107.79 TaxID=1447943 RepID=A0A6A5UZT2_9PLEO|nr:alkaline phytoceramidase [Bimuria novae-zelandiae CBS 107.79]
MVANILKRLPSVNYPPAQEGRWSPVTSTLNWCEEDYYATVYAAEIVNTLTNTWFMYLSAKGIRSCLTNGHGTVFLVSYIGYLLVGTGSFLFHATLKYPMQLIDELSMIYTTCLMCYVTFSFDKTRSYRTILATLLVGSSLFITLYYHFLQDPVFHQTTYAILTAVVFFRAVYVMETLLRPKFRSQQRANSGSKAVQEREDQRDLRILKEMWVMIGWGLSIFLGGFFFWYLDIAHCSTLRRWRREIGMPWGFFLELHGWWHLMTGLGGYCYIVWGIWLRHCLNGRQDEYELHWPQWTTMPVVVKTQKAANRRSNGHGGGEVKKEL